MSLFTTDLTHTARTIRCNTIVLHLVIRVTVMRLYFEVLLTKRLLTVLTLEWQKVDQKARCMGALFADGE